MAKRLPQQFKGKPHWTVRRVSRIRHHGEECWGRCDYDTRTILLANSAERRGVDRDTFIHEFVHRIMPFLDEDAVRLLATELDCALDAMDM